MADSDVQITAGSGTKVDTRTVGAGTDEHRQVVVIGDPTTAANVAGVDANGATKTRLVDGSGTAIATGVQYVEDGALGTNGQGTLVVARRDDALSTLTPVEDDAVGLRTNNRGALWTKHDGTMTVDGSGVTQPVSGTVTANAGTGPFPVSDNGGSLTVDGSVSAVSAGDVAHDAVDSGNPVKIGGKASSSAPTAVAANDRVDGWFGTAGQQVVATVSGSGNSSADGLLSTGLLAPGNTNIQNPIGAAVWVSNGSNWDKARSVSIGDGAAATGIAASGLMGYNGTTWDRVRVANTGRLQVDVVSGGSVAQGGDVAHDGVDSGNPVKIGGYASGTAPTAVASGDRTNAWFSLNGAQMTSPVAGEGNGADGATGGLWSARGGGTQGSPMPAANYLYNGSTFDRMRGDITNGLDVDVTRVQGSVAVTGTFWQATQPVSGTVTANAGTGTMATSLAAGPPPHNVGITPLGINFTASTTQTSVNLIAGTGGQRIYVTHLTISTGGTTAGRVSVYYGTGAFTAGTSQTVFDGEFAPSATSRPGAVLQFPVPVGGASATGDNLRITTSAAMTVYVTGQAYKA